MTPSGIEPETFRIVAHHLNHCATAVPSRLMCRLVLWVIGTYTSFAKFYRQCLLGNMPLAVTARFMLDCAPANILVDLCAMYSVPS